MRQIQITILMLALASFFGCDAFGQTARIGEPFTLKAKESATLHGTGIQITLNRIGRKWGTTPNAGESLDLSFSVKRAGQIHNFNESSPAPIEIGEYKIEIVKTEPFSEGFVTFVVNKSDSNDAVAAEFVERFDWHIDEKSAPTKMPGIYSSVKK